MTTPAVFPSLMLPGAIAAPARSQVYVDGIPVAAQAAATPTRSLQPPASQRFWSSEPRAYGDPANEMMIVQLSSPKLINYVSLSLPHFPAEYSVAWQDSDGEWAWVNGPNGYVLQFIISGSVPAVVDSAAALSAGLNPYHYGANHWIPFDEMIQPVTAAALLVAGTRALQQVIRGNPGKLPSSAAGRPVPYPLGVKGLDFGYRVLQPSDVPYSGRSDSVITERESFSVADDINGFPVLLTMRENRASDLLSGHPWKCAPQPSSQAVVNLYADTRGPGGAAQVIDRFYIDPTTSGVALNLYYAPSPPPHGSGFQAVDTPLAFPLVVTAGAATPAPDVAGLLFSSSQPGWCDVLNQGTGIDFTQPWWTAVEIQPLFGPSDPGTYYTADFGPVQLWYAAGTWYMASEGAVIASWQLSWQPSDRMQFACGWDGRLLYAWSEDGGGTTTAADAPPGTTLVRFGALQVSVQTPEPGNFRLTSWILKQEAPSGQAGVPQQFLDFAAGPPERYTAPASGPGPTTVNACGRFDISLVNKMLAPQGFAGGTGTAWSACHWIPLTGDYRLTAGYIQFRPVLAAGFRFEFTGLLPETYSYYKGTPQAAQYFPVQQLRQPPGGYVAPLAPATVSSSSAALSGPSFAPWDVTPSQAADPGLATAQSVLPPSYADAPALPLPFRSGGALPTEAIYGTDPEGAAAMARQGEILGFKPWQVSPQHWPRQVTAGTQAYQQISVTQQHSIGYFAGLSKLIMYRADYTAAADTPEYISTFGDTAGINPASLQQPAAGSPAVPWVWSPGLLTAPPLLPGGYAQTVSAVYTSVHQVTGVQFAAVQSGPVQLMPDPSFAQPGVPYLSPVGDALPLTVSASNSSPLGSLVIVTRAPGQPSWLQMQNSYASWGALLSPPETWLQLQGTPETSPYGGVAYTGAPVAVSAAGRVTIAARVFSTAPLQAQLQLQLLDGATGVVIAQEPFTVSANTPAEWTAQCTVGVGTPGNYTWSQVQAKYASWSAFGGLSWSQVDTSTAGLGSTVTWQIIEQGLFTDSWGVDDVSVFEDSALWEFSNDGGTSWWPAYDISANPSGALVFPPPAQGAGNQLAWRLTGYRPGLTVASLAIRPWYSIYPRGVPPRVQGLPHGPNVSGQDTYGPITLDPYWQAWDGPVPQYWFWAYQKLLQAGTTYQPPPPPPAPSSGVVPGRALVVQAGAPPLPPTITDIYADAYGYYYGVADASQDYDDKFGSGGYFDDFRLNT